LNPKLLNVYHYRAASSVSAAMDRETFARSVGKTLRKASGDAVTVTIAT
jgi:hypothetical protein